MITQGSRAKSWFQMYINGKCVTIYTLRGNMRGPVLQPQQLPASDPSPPLMAPSLDPKAIKNLQTLHSSLALHQISSNTRCCFPFSVLGQVTVTRHETCNTDSVQWRNSRAQASGTVCTPCALDSVSILDNTCTL